MIALGKHLSFSDEDLVNLGGEINQILDDMETQYADLFESQRDQWSMYEAEKRTEVKNYPYPRASNIVIPIVRIHADATIARYLQLIRPSSNVWTANSDNEDFVASGLVKEIPRFINWGAKNDFHFDEVLEEWVQEIVVTGPGVLGLDWDTQTVNVLGADKQITEVILSAGPLLRHIPRENILWDTNHRVWAAPFVAVKRYMTWQDIVLRVNGGWNWDVAQKFKGQTVSNREAGGDQVSRDKDKRSGSDWDNRPEIYSLYDIRRVYVDWTVVGKSLDLSPPNEMEEGDVLTTVVVDLHRDSGLILDITTIPYALAGKPFYDAYFKKRSGTVSSVGLGKLLGDFQESASTSINQAHDAVHKANSINGVSSDPELADAEFSWNKIIYSPDAKDFKEIGISTGVMPDIALSNQMEIYSERVSGVNDPGLGRETRMGGHPAPATSTLQLLQEGKKLDITAINSLRSAVAYLGRDIALLYQQFEDNELKVFKAVGSKDGEKILKWLKGPSALGVMEFDLAAVSETMNPQLEQQKATGVFQLTANFYSLASQFLTLASNPQAPPALVMSMLQGLKALSASYEKILDSGDIDDTTPFLLDVESIAQQVVEQRNAAASAAGGQQGPGGPQGPPQRPQGNGSASLGSGM